VDMEGIMDRVDSLGLAIQKVYATLQRSMPTLSPLDSSPTMIPRKEFSHFC
jgi:hypothetical protein